MNEEIIGIEVSGEIYPIKDEKTSGKAQTLETKVSIAEVNITNLETASTEQGEKLAQIEANIGETDIQELKSLVDAHEEEIKELDPTWKLFGQTLGRTPITISGCNELMITFYFTDAGIIINIPILYADVTPTVRHFCNSFNRNASLQLDVDIAATTSEVAISSAMWGGNDVSSVCGITVRYR